MITVLHTSWLCIMLFDLICVITKQIFQTRNQLNPTNLSGRLFGLLIIKVCHLGMWTVIMHQLSCGTLNDQPNVMLMPVFHVSNSGD